MALSHLNSLCLVPLHKTLLQHQSPPIPRLPISRHAASVPTSSTVFAPLLPRRGNGKRRLGLRCSAVVEGLGLQPQEEEKVLVPKEEGGGDEGKADYDWREEWYPLYLSKEVPDDAPLGLTVFHKQLVLYRDGEGVFRCYEDRCPHRLAKLSEGQIVDGKLECLYHGWRFEGAGQCVSIPQLPEGAKIPRSACLKKYEVKDSQGVVWVWMSEKNSPDMSKLPHFEHYDKPGFRDNSAIQELPYDHSILLENLMDPSHVPISHDRTDFSARREDAQPLVFEVLERTDRGFAGNFWKTKTPNRVTSTRFEAPCNLQNNLEFVDKNGKTQYYSSLFLCRPAGQGKCMLIVRFGSTSGLGIVDLIPRWFIHQNSSKVFEQDMGFLSSQNETLIKEKVPTKELYLNLKSSDTWVAEYRKWIDKVGHGMPYHFGHSTVSPPKEPAVLEQAPAGLVAGISANMPAKGGLGGQHYPNPASRYFRHVIHCKGCRSDVQKFETWRNLLQLVSLVAVAAAILASTRQLKVVALASAVLFMAGSYACSSILSLLTTNFIRVHRRL